MRFETDAEFYFDFFLAEKLGMTVADMRRKLSTQEYMQWGVWYGKKAQAEELARLRAKG